MARLTARADIAELLEQFGATPEPLSLEDQFRVACGRRDRELAASLLRQHPALLQDNQLFRDCAMVDIETCLGLVRRGYDINTRGHEGQTVLHDFALWNNPNTVATLLQHGADRGPGKPLAGDATGDGAASPSLARRQRATACFQQSPRCLPHG